MSSEPPCCNARQVFALQLTKENASSGVRPHCRGCVKLRGCHGLVPLEVHDGCYDELQATSWMPRACPVEIHLAANLAARLLRLAASGKPPRRPWHLRSL